MDNFERYLVMAMDWAVIFVPKVLMAGIILWVGLRVISKISTLTNMTLTSRNIDPTIRPFFVSLVDVGLKFFLFVIVAGIFGFEISSILALIGALAFAVGLALQGSLGHFASGILLLVLKPYRVGDEIKSGDAEGFVEEIQVFNTILRTRDNRHIIIPNGVITSGNIINHTSLGQRRVDMSFIVDEPNSVDTVLKVLQKAVASCPDVLEDPATEIFLESFTADELHFACRPWCKSEKYWAVWGFMQKAVKDGFDEADLTGNVHYIQMVQDRLDMIKARKH
ncbi:MAG: mechanosensitive ion channel [Saprospiraceae bacterium]|nr:mechanosensitive ion channel [Saprospiraceae bacterium]